MLTLIFVFTYAHDASRYEYSDDYNTTSDPDVSAASAKTANEAQELYDNSDNYAAPTAKELPSTSAVAATSASKSTPTGDAAPKKAKGGKVTAADVGRRVAVEGYEGQGTLRFVGPHHESGAVK
jgi:hypothetical protein